MFAANGAFMNFWWAHCASQKVAAWKQHNFSNLFHADNAHFLLKLIMRNFSPFVTIFRLRLVFFGLLIVQELQITIICLIWFFLLRLYQRTLLAHLIQILALEEDRIIQNILLSCIAQIVIGAGIANSTAHFVQGIH